jgi:pimeloyl-ACP methyl ester carboxylesterase
VSSRVAPTNARFWPISADRYWWWPVRKMRHSPCTKVREMAENIPGASFVVLNGVAHLAALESPDTVIPLIDEFLAAHGCG